MVRRNGRHMVVKAPIPEDRPLSSAERRLVQWLLEHGTSEAAGFLPQLSQARVTSQCPCGCASVDFAIGGVIAPAEAGMRILSDFGWQAADGSRFGVFVFACAGQLSGLEVWSVDGQGATPTLPEIKELVP